jgi:class 3 adenylate cyclase
MTGPIMAEFPRGEMRKTVTAVFCDLVDSTALSERLEVELFDEVMGLYFSATSAALEQNEGTVDKFIGDAVVGIFGAPRAQEDDAIRAVRAAVEMRDAVRDLNASELIRYDLALGVRVGVNTGEAIVREASAGRGVVIGEPINVAARLQQFAGPNDILIGAETYELAASAIVAEPIRPIRAKGKAHLTPAFRVIEVLEAGGGGSSLGRVGRFVGRQHELNSMLEGLRKHRAGRPQTVLVTGAPGIGKSRLAREFLSVSGTSAVRESCRSLGTVTLSSLVARLEAKSATVEAVLLDDAQSATDTLLEELTSLFTPDRDSRRWLGLFVGRPELASRPELSALASQITHVELGALPVQDTEHLVRGVATFNDDLLVTRLAVRAEGNPLHARELARYAARSGHWPAGSEPPPTIRALILARVDELPLEEHAVLECAAVIGARVMELTLTELAAECGCSDPVAQIEALVARQLLRRSPGSANVDVNDLAFDNTTSWEVVYGSMLRTTRAHTHEAYARLLQARDERSPGSDKGQEIARHLIGAAENAPMRDTRAAAHQESLAREAIDYLVDVGPTSQSEALVISELARRAANILPVGTSSTDEAQERPTGPAETAVALSDTGRGEAGADARRAGLVLGQGETHEQWVRLDPARTPIEIGRRSDAAVRISDPEASREHARLSWDRRTWWIEDLESRNGTAVNRLPVKRKQPLRDGDLIQIGSSRLRFASQP